jgi:hypothetical protein
MDVVHLRPCYVMIHELTQSPEDSKPRDSRQKVFRARELMTNK